MSTPLEFFDYELPEELIAYTPAQKRDECRMMILDKTAKIRKNDIFKSILDILTPRDFLVVNNTGVMNARLDAKKVTGGLSEFFVTELLSENTCKAIVRGSFKPGAELIVAGKRAILKERDDTGVWFCEMPETDIGKLMKECGHIPLPPYIRRADTEADKVDYQTVYSKIAASAAAPTAGLHFTDELIRALREKGIKVVEITLDVGLGTFKPVKTQTLEEHKMHSERYNISDDAAEEIVALKREGKRLIAVGSTVVRALESASADDGSSLKTGESSTDLLIVPGYRFKMVDAMITNFHLPKSTLLAMVAAFCGLDFIMNSYKYAVSERYRFFSYGDAMLIL